MATFVLVHGGGHGGWCWRPVARLLRAAGHEVHTPTLTGLGERRHLATPETGLETHIEDVAALLFHEDLEDVVLAGHSYGGMVITGAADRAPDRIACLAFLDAPIPHDGEALVDISPGLLRHRDLREVGGVRLGLWPDASATEIYGISDLSLAQWVLPRLAPHPWRCFEDRLNLADARAVAQLPCAVVHCAALMQHRPDHVLRRMNAVGHVRTIDTGHDLMLTAPERTAALLEDIAAFARQQKRMPHD